ncbi:IQ domain-containing protein K [Taenia crassiceps]|uniref:IQ domain-containing protein K n=1 Tax=Taenia crassiceps TaxID=6207 RepID=A0ABR4QAC5_9CEST
MTSFDFLPVKNLIKISRTDDPNTPAGYFKLRLLPVVEKILRSLLTQIIANDVLQRPHSRFNALHYLTLELYRNNPAKSERIDTIKKIEDIAWVAEHWKLHPPTELPLGWNLTRAEAATIIQKHWRGYSVRIQAEVQELRKWQQEWRLQRDEGKS